jgi:hypothetical protein
MSVHSIATLLRKFDLFLIFIVLLFYLWVLELQLQLNKHN